MAAFLAYGNVLRNNGNNEPLPNGNNGPSSQSKGDSQSSVSGSSTRSIETISTSTWSCACATMRSVEDLGQIISLDQARQDIRLNFTLPTVLPYNLSLQEIRGSQNFVSLVYLSPSIDKINNLNRGNLIIYVARDNTTYSPARSTSVVGGGEGFCETMNNTQSCTFSSNFVTVAQTTMQNISVSSHPGLSVDILGSNDVRVEGSVEWWSKGVHFYMLAALPDSTLISIAQSMNT